MPQYTWLALGYNVPVNPSKNRVYVWRKLKELGAGYFRPGVALLPKSPQHMQSMRQLSVKIKEMGGEAVIAELRYMDAKDEQEAIARFRTQSETEYDELLRDCANLTESIKENVFPPDDRRDRVKKVMRRYHQVQARDYFKAEQRGRTKSALEELLEDIGELF